MAREQLPEGERSRGVVVLFTAAIFIAAALLFVVQPMIAKMMLPKGGGSPQVWNTSLVFFQATLLAGYLYAHWSVRRFGVRTQAMVHLVVLLLPLLLLPIALPGTNPTRDSSPSFWILGALTVAVGAPFFVLAAASPLLQRWLASTRFEAGRDPYFLYAASNAGSLAGLLAYPFLLEPLVGLRTQAELWTFGYITFVAIAILCVAIVVRSPAASVERPLHDTPSYRADRPPPTPSDRFFWLAASAVPSSLLLGVTQFLTTQIAPFPLLWVLPLAVYLTTFIVAFARREIVSAAIASRLVAIVTVAAALGMLAHMVDPTWAVVFLHLTTLGVAALLCHVRLVDRRPDTDHLTEFYLFIALGGVIGGASTALIAPYVFDRITEYPIALVLACLFRLPMTPPQDASRSVRFLYEGRVLDFLLPAGLALYIFVVESEADWAIVMFAAVVPALVAFLFSPRPRRFALGVAVLMAFALSGRLYRGDILFTERTFFGTHRVSLDQAGTVNILYHGSTVHGIQSRDPARAREPLGYYHPSGPAGGVLQAFAAQPDKTDLALVGAGTGALAVLAATHQHVILYEVDPAIARIAEDQELFTYLTNTRASYEIVVGDGRIALSESTSRFDLIVLDAFSSGSIPIHLLTREALQLYLDRLEPGGALLFHISNRHLDLRPVLGAHARQLGLVAYERIDARDEEERGILSSHWVILARSPMDLQYIPSDGWVPLLTSPAEPSWTDDFSNLLSVQRWR